MSHDLILLSPEELEAQRIAQAHDNELAARRQAYAQEQARLDADDQARAELLARYAAEDKDENGIPKDWYRFVDFVRYLPATGQIVGWGRQSKAGIAHEDALFPNDAYLCGPHCAGITSETHWVEGGELRERTPCPARLEGRWLRGLPAPCTIRLIDPTGVEAVHPCPEPEVEFDLEGAGTYTVTVYSIPHRDGTYAIEVAP